MLRSGPAKPAGGRPDLGDVTLCAADSANVALTARALRLSMAGCDFADAILFSHAPVSGPFRTVTIQRLDSTHAYSTFVLKELPGLVQTPFVLIVQWDGYVVDAGAWDPAFRGYDYVGARWPGAGPMSVGNGGFSLRSRTFMSALAGPRFVLDKGQNGDWQVCRLFRPDLERDFGVRFAPEPVADRFSYENAEPAGPTFGFHGMGNLTRHVDDTALVRLLDDLAPYVMRTGHCARLLGACFVAKRLVPLKALYARMTAEIGVEGVRRLVRRASGDEAFTVACIAFCEARSN